jgi:hypothetical protein
MFLGNYSEYVSVFSILFLDSYDLIMGLIFENSEKQFRIKNLL